MKIYFALIWAEFKSRKFLLYFYVCMIALVLATLITDIIKEKNILDAILGLRFLLIMLLISSTSLKLDVFKNKEKRLKIYSGLPVSINKIADFRLYYLLAIAAIPLSIYILSYVLLPGAYFSYLRFLECISILSIVIIVNYSQYLSMDLRQHSIYRNKNKIIKSFYWIFYLFSLPILFAIILTMDEKYVTFNIIDPTNPDPYSFSILVVLLMLFSTFLVVFSRKTFINRQDFLSQLPANRRF